MGLMNRILGLGRTAKDITEVFVANKTEADAHAMARFSAVQDGYQAEFSSATRFDYLINGLNRLPRPLMALGTIALFAFAMIDPGLFATRMEGLSYVPEPLWWLLGAIVSFYFGARELHHFRTKPVHVPNPKASPRPSDNNAALVAWQASSLQAADRLDES